MPLKRIVPLMVSAEDAEQVARRGFGITDEYLAKTLADRELMDKIDRIAGPMIDLEAPGDAGDPV
jgi:hypothetical protein